MSIVITASPQAEEAAQAYAERTGTCVQAALDAAGLVAYCHCATCGEGYAAEAAAEAYAEGAWLRAAENAQYTCYCGQGQPGICC